MNGCMRMMHNLCFEGCSSKEGRKEGRSHLYLSHLFQKYLTLLPIIDFMSCYAHSRPVMVTKVLHWLQNTDPECA